MCSMTFQGMNYLSTVKWNKNKTSEQQKPKQNLENKQTQIDIIYNNDTNSGL